MTTTSHLLKALQSSRLFQFTHLTSSQLPSTTTTQIQKDALSSLHRRIPIYLASTIAFLSISVMTHTNDDYYIYYPLPFAIDIGEGASMMPTMIPGEVYLRDCWSDRFFSFDLLRRILPTGRDTTGDVAMNSNTETRLYKRPYQKGDIVTIYNPHTQNLICKRIIGISGDTIHVFGQYAQSYHEESNTNIDLGVPPDNKYPIPYCIKEAQRQTIQQKYLTTMTVPQDHVWVEGDNPLYSIDSRHFGPLPLSSLRGRVSLRLWPIRRGFGDGRFDGCWLSLDRPRPFMSGDEIVACGVCGVKKVEEERKV